MKLMLVAIPVVCAASVAFIDPVTAAIVFVCMAAAVCLAAGLLFYYIAISRKSDKSLIFAAPHNAQLFVRTKEDAQRKARHLLWRERAIVEEVSIKSIDNLDLHASIIQNKPNSRCWAVVCHGYAHIGKEYMMFIAQTFHEMGYWVLMPDARGHGKSGGEYIGMGWPDRMDVIQWVHEIGRRDYSANIVLYGISMGAATVLMASGEPLPQTVKAVVADCGYNSAMKECAYQLKMLFGLPPFPILHFASLITRIRAGYWLGEASALRQIAKSETPILLIHGSADTFVPPFMLEELYEAAVCPKQKLLVEGAGHGQSPLVDRTRYWQTISDFLQIHDIPASNEADETPAFYVRSGGS